MWCKVLLLSVVVLQFFVFSSAEAADHDFLKGLEEVQIIIDDLPDAAKDVNLSKKMIRKDGNGVLHYLVFCYVMEEYYWSLTPRRI